MGQDSLVKSPEELVDIYYKSVGRNALLLLNLPPDKRGLIHENDVEALQGFRKRLDETFVENRVSINDNINININNSNNNSSNNSDNNNAFSANRLFDGDFETYWAAEDTAYPVELIIEFPEAEFNVIMLQEPIWLGQRVSRFEILAMTGQEWLKVFEGTTIGYKRLVRIEPLFGSTIKVRILESNNTIAISEMGIYKASSAIPF